MVRMSSVAIVLLLATTMVCAQESPHGSLSWSCTDCHTTADWKKLLSPMNFDHAKTSFALYGEHRNTACKNCHSTLRFSETPRNCISCHQADFDAAVVINHRMAGFSTDCVQCHRFEGASWQASFDHQKTQFPIRGAHDAVACVTCHTKNRFRGTPIECVRCHETEYLAAKNPDHKSAGFSSDCAVCHRARTWIPAVFFPHGAFPIAAGDRHSPGVWNSCSDCHPSQPAYSSFECINCHAHQKSRMDQQHSDIQGYLYQSTSCYRCHPQGTGE
jgi:hypothetical protein